MEDLDNILNEMITMSDYKNRGQQYEALKKLFGGGGSFNKKQMLNAFINESDKLLKNMPNNNPLPQELIILKQAMWSVLMTKFENMLLAPQDNLTKVEDPEEKNKEGMYYNGRKPGVVI